ncbi:MAG: hypothetical protein ABR509_04125 [Candidatus Limnocylindria bacterium]
MTPVALAVFVLGLALLAGGAWLVRRSGARVRMAIRFARAPMMRVGDLAAARRIPREGEVRVAGRVRCSQPLVTPDGERLVLLHRRVEVRLPTGTWRTVEQLREARDFELWDHAGQLTIDAARCTEPLLAIPAVWRGGPDELPAGYRAEIAAVEELAGVKADAARAETRAVSVVDRLLVLARPELAPDGSVSLAPPETGYVISAVPMDAAMRLLGGTRRLLLAGVAAAAIGIAALGAATLMALADLVL